MEYEQTIGHYSPDWKGDYSYMKDPGAPGSFKIPVKALSITWGNDPRYWQRIKLTEEEAQFTGFEEAAFLQQVNWIEVMGKLDLSPFNVAVTTTYTINYIIKFRVDAYGWHSAPIKFKVRINGKESKQKKIMEPYRMKHDEWHEVPGGEFCVSNGITAGSVEFGMFEDDTDWWKGSMVLAGIKIKPKTG